MTVSHLDLYRIASLEAEDPDLLADYLGEGRIAFVEWPEDGARELAGARLLVRISHRGADERERASWTAAIEPPASPGAAATA